MPGARAGRGPRAGRGRRHLRQRPEVLPRGHEVLGRRDAARVGRDRGRPRPRVRRRGRRSSTTRRARAGAWRSATGSSPSRSCRAGTAATAGAGSTGCARRTTSSASSAAPPARWRSTCVFPAEALVHRVSADLPAAHAAFAEPLSCALHAVERGRHRLRRRRRRRRLRSDRARAWSRAPRPRAPPHVVALDMAPAKLALARQCGADTLVDIRDRRRAWPWCRSSPRATAATSTSRAPATRPPSCRG